MLVSDVASVSEQYQRLRVLIYECSFGELGVQLFAGMCLLTPVFLQYTSIINLTVSFIIYYSVGMFFSSLSTLIPLPPPPRIFAFLSSHFVLCKIASKSSNSLFSGQLEIFLYTSFARVYLIIYFQELPHSQPDFAFSYTSEVCVISFLSSLSGAACYWFV